MLETELSAPGTVSRFVEMFRSMETPLLTQANSRAQTKQRPNKSPTKDKPEVRIRLGQIADCPRILELINELSKHLNFDVSPSITAEDLQRDGFPEDGKKALFHLMVTEDGQAGVVGFALLYPFYSGWLGKGYVLELLYIQPNYRRQGLGKRLLSNVARFALDNDAKQIRLDVSQDNIQALKFYVALGFEDFAIKFPSVHGRFHGDVLQALASQADKLNDDR